jgi:uncharacterized protein
MVSGRKILQASQITAMNVPNLTESMKEILRNIFYLPVQNDFLVYSPLNGISALLNRTGLLGLKKQLQFAGTDTADPDSKLLELANEILNTPANKILKKEGEFTPEFLGIIPTRSCNGACNYCDFGAEKFQNDNMSYEMVVQVVDWFTKLIVEQNRKILDIHFFGGEPMVAFDVIEVAVHRARLMAYNNKLFPVFEISTNGQYSEDKAEWLGNYFNKVLLSFDGLRESHNRHRPLKGGHSSYENVYRTAKIIGESNAELSIRCCISQLNIEQMPEMTHWFCKNFRLSALNFEILSASEITKGKGLFPPDPVDFAINFQRSKDIARSYGIEVIYASDISNLPQVTSCPVGKDTAIISPDGRISNCYLLPEKWQDVGLDLDFGIVKPGEEVELNNKNIAFIRQMVEDKPRCKSCFCKWSCSGGCHVGTTYPACSTNFDDFCRQTRLISLFSLLADMDMDRRISTLIKNTNSLNKIANQKSDMLLDFPC